MGEESRPGRCENCRFWDMQDVSRVEGNDNPFGTCHRFPPVIALGQLPTWFQEEITTVKDLDAKAEPEEGRWLSTKWDDWCGEFQPSIGLRISAYE